MQDCVGGVWVSVYGSEFRVRVLGGVDREAVCLHASILRMDILLAPVRGPRVGNGFHRE